jgi:predicted phage terminase large subunit-like protein|tara:strand:- start:4686 stop:6188 length:1503 start_codon:yes stop_codon:yes gene_type:complete
MKKSKNFEKQWEEQNALKKLKRNIGLFGKTMFPSALNRSVPSFHHEIYKALSDETLRRVLIAAPRGTAKSTVTSLILPLHKVAFKPSDRDLFIVIISESQSQSINFLSRIKYHLENSKNFTQMFGDYGPTTAKRWTNNDIVLANGSRIVAVGTGQRVRGFIEGDTRPNLIVVDDYESELNAATAEGRAKNRKWMTEAVIPSLSDDGRVVLIGTVISEDCFLYWAKESTAWHVLWFSIWDEHGESIWKERFPIDRIKQIKEEFESVGNLNGFYQEYMNEAQSPDNAPFKPEYIKLHHYTYKREGGQNLITRTIDGDTVRKPVDIYCGIDPASSLAARSDFFVIATIGIDNDGNNYIIDIYRDKLDPALQPEKIIDIFKKFSPKRMKIETVGYQEALRANVRKMMFEQSLYIPGLEKGIKPRQRKSERLLSLVAPLARGEFYFRPEDLVAQQEFLSYPRGKHDDILDAIYYAMVGIRPCRQKEYINSDEKKTSNKFLDWMTM